MSEPEQSAGAGNNWWETLALKCRLFVPDDETEAARAAVKDIVSRTVTWSNSCEDRIHIQLRVDGIDVPVEQPN